MKVTEVLKELGPKIKLKVIHMHGPTNIGGKSYGSTIFADKLGCAELLFFPQANIVAILDGGKFHFIHAAGIDSSTSFEFEDDYEEEKPAKAKK